MNILQKCPATLSRAKVFCRSLSSTSVLNMKEWRVERGLPINRNAEGILTDGPDYTYLDGRPTPLLGKQKARIQKQREFATKMVEMCSELNFAKERYQNMEEAKEKERQAIITNRLKPKGNALISKKK